MCMCLPYVALLMAVADPAMELPIVVARTVKAPPVAGRLVEIAAPGEIVLRGPGDERRRLPWASLVELRMPACPVALPCDRARVSEAPATWSLELVDGRWIMAEALRGDAKELVAAHRLLGEMSIPAAAVSHLIRSATAGRAARATAAGRTGSDSSSWLTTRPAEPDSGEMNEVGMVLLNGDRVDGEVTGLEPGGVRVHGVAGEMLVPLEQIAEWRRVRPRPANPQAGVVAWLDLVDGSRLAAERLSGDGSTGMLEGTLAGEDRLRRLPLGQVLRIRGVSDRWAWLSDRLPVEIDNRTIFGAPLPAGRDVAVTGAPLIVGKRRFERGLGVHAPCRLAYDLHGDWNRLEGAVGLDASAAGSAGAKVSIRLDGRVVWQREALVPADGLVAWRVDVSGVRRLELIVEPGPGGEVLDRANWVDLLLVR